MKQSFFSKCFLHFSRFILLLAILTLVSSSFFYDNQEQTCYKDVNDAFSFVEKSDHVDSNITVLLAVEHSLNCDLPDSVKSRWAHELGVQLYLVDRYAEACERFKQAIKFRAKDNKNLITSLNGLTQSALRNYDFVTAKQAIDKQVSLLQNGSDNEALGNLYFASGEISFELADYEHAAEQLALAENYYRLSKSDNLANVLNLLGAVFHKKRAYSLALKYYQEAEQLYLKDSNDYERAIVLHNEAMTLTELDDYAVADSKFRLAIQINLKYADSIELARNYYEYALLLNKTKRVADHEKYIRESLTIRKQHLPLWHPDLIESGFGQIEMHLSKGESQLAETLFRQLESGFNQCPIPEIAIWSADLRLRMDESSKGDDGQISVSEYQNIDSLIQNLRILYPNDASKRAFAERVRRIYNRISSKLSSMIRKDNKDTEAINTWFTITQHAKAAALADELLLKKEMSDKRLSATLVEKQRALKLQLGSAVSEALSKTSSDETQPLLRKIDSLQRQIAGLKINVSTYSNTFGKDLERLVEKLSTNDVCINYFICDSTLQRLSIANGVFSFTEQPLKESLWLAWSKGLSVGVNDTAQSKLLSRYLLGDLLSVISKNEKLQLIIIPDGSIGSLPFDALNFPSEKGFLLFHASVNLITNVEDFVQSRNSFWKKLMTKTVAVFSLSYQGNQQGLSALPEAENETKKLKQVFSQNTQSYQNTEASKDVFVQTLKQNNTILHIAAHGFVDSVQPLLSGMLFFDKKTNAYSPLTAAEIYGINCESSLIYLSACETGIGKVTNSEGILSLGRAFLYTGIDSEVITLWSVSDKSTAEIAVNFYEFLREGHTKPTAMRLAKIKYLEECSTAQGLSPYHWAAQVFVGNPAPMYFPKYILGLLLFFSGVGIYIFIKKRLSRPKVDLSKTV